MKIVLVTVGAAVGLLLFIVGWTAAGRLMTKPDDWSVLQSVIIRGLLVGAVLSGGWWSWKKVMAMDQSEKADSKGKGGCH